MIEDAARLLRAEPELALYVMTVLASRLDAVNGHLIEARARLGDAGPPARFSGGNAGPARPRHADRRADVSDCRRDEESVSSVLFYLAAAVGEIAGCFAFWAWLRLDRSPWRLVPGTLSLVDPKSKQDMHKLSPSSD